MINIKFENKDDMYKLSVSGHAGYDEKGKDIVCAAVSILFYTLCETLSNMDEALKDVTEIHFDDGEGEITVRAKEEYIGNVSLIFFTIMNGFSLLQEEYSDFVKIFL